MNEEKNALEKGGEFLLKNSGRALMMGKDPISVSFGVATASVQVITGATLLSIEKIIKKKKRK